MIFDCKWCGRPTAFAGTKFCTDCWEVSGRINRILETEGGRAVLREIVLKATNG